MWNVCKITHSNLCLIWLCFFNTCIVIWHVKPWYRCRLREFYYLFTCSIMFTCIMTRYVTTSRIYYNIRPWNSFFIDYLYLTHIIFIVRVLMSTTGVIEIKIQFHYQNKIIYIQKLCLDWFGISFPLHYARCTQTLMEIETNFYFRVSWILRCKMLRELEKG